MQYSAIMLNHTNVSNTANKEGGGVLPQGKCRDSIVNAHASNDRVRLGKKSPKLLGETNSDPANLLANRRGIVLFYH